MPAPSPPSIPNGPRLEPFSVWPWALVAGGFLLAAILIASVRNEPLGVTLAIGGLAVSALAIARSRGVSPRSESVSSPPTEELLSALRQIAQALEAGPLVPRPSPATDPLAPIRGAIREGNWPEVLEQVESLRAGGELSPEFAAEVDRHRETAETDLRARLDASRQANDAESVLRYRAQLVPLLADEVRRQLDTELIRWFMALLIRRMRAGTVRADVAELAGAIAEAFPATSEGASLRASLPTLRRSAGLCPRCAEPYVGVDDACPRCLGQPEPVASPEAVEAPEVDDLPPVDRDPEDDPFLPSD
jgi:hypothetical protein